MSNFKLANVDLFKEETRTFPRSVFSEFTQVILSYGMFIYCLAIKRD